jgi:tRNA A-37 threonylcarbamoyl transferase component Bud32
VRDELIGKAIKCPKCGKRFAVAANGSVAAVAATVVPSALSSDPLLTTDQHPSAAAPAPDVTGALEHGSHTAEPAIAPDVEHSGTECLSQPSADSLATQEFAPAPETGATISLPEADGAGTTWSLGEYRIVRELGEGGMGTVYEAEDAKLKRHVALKVMKPEIAKHPRHRERFLREARTAAKVKSDFICPIYRVGEDNGVPFIAMPFLKGEPLDAHLKQGRRLPIDEVLRIGTEVAQGLSVAHDAGLVHRDIKPSNIWLETPRSGPRRAIILDFGLARMQADDVHITQSGAIIGTPAFMSPEQARGDKTVDARTDLFSLGCVLYVLCTGELPFKSDTTMGVLMALATHDPPPPHQIARATPKPLSRLIMRLLAKKPDDRPQTASEVMEALAEIDADPANAVEGTFTTQLEALPAGGDLPAMSAEPATPKGKRRPAAATRAQTRTTWYVLVGLLGLLGCVAPLAGFGVYYLYKTFFPGGQGPNPVFAGVQNREIVAPENKAPSPPTGEVPAGWVVVESPRRDYSVAMPQKPTTQVQPGARVSRVQLPNGLALTAIDEPFGAARLRQMGGAARAVDQLMATLLVTSGAVLPGGKMPEATKITLGQWEGREARLPHLPGATSRGYIGIQMGTVPGGAKITSVMSNAPADRAGLKPNDIVYEAGGRQVTDHKVLNNTILSGKIGGEMLFKVKRGQENLELPVIVGLGVAPGAYVRVYLIGNHLVMLMGAAEGGAAAPETAAFFNSLKLGGEEQLAAAEAKLPIHEVGKGLELRGQLDGHTVQLVYRVKLAAGTTYVIDMVTPNQLLLDPYLVLTDATGKQLAEDDDSGGGLNAQITFRPEQDGPFRIVATSINYGTGAFTLTVRETTDPPKKDKQKGGFKG